jgi:O-succinylbenzoate synthase
VSSNRPSKPDHRAKLSRAEVRLVAIPLLDRLAAAHDPDPSPTRQLTIVEVVDEAGRSGFGECSALTRAGYTDEWAAGAFEELRRRGTMIGLTSPMAHAAVEMGMLDLELRAEERSLATHVHRLAGLAADTVPATVPAGFVVPLGTPDEVLAAADGFVRQGIGRMKIKIDPDHLSAVIGPVRAAYPDLDLQVDGNGSLDRTHLDELLALDALGVSAIEQPFAVNDIDAARVLVAHCRADVVADEAATDLAAVTRLVEIGACTAVSIKPPRLGGLQATMRVYRWCAESGVALTAGGMLESGLGRRALAAVASLPGFTITGDVSPARRWLAEDPWPDLDMAHGRIAVPVEPGIAPPPDRALLDRLTLDRAPLPIH